MKRSELKSRRIRIEVLSDCYLSTGVREKGWGGGFFIVSSQFNTRLIRLHLFQLHFTNYFFSLGLDISERITESRKERASCKVFMFLWNNPTTKGGGVIANAENVKGWVLLLDSNILSNLPHASEG